MATITLSSDVILEVLKFVPYENATKLVLMSKRWVLPLQVKLKEQRIAIVAEIRRLESIDLVDKEREINSTWNRLLQDKKQLCADLKTSAFNAKDLREQDAAITLFNQRRLIIEADMNAQYIEYCAIARKRQPIIEKIENLESKLDQCGKSETERLADLERRKNRYSTTLTVTFAPTSISNRLNKMPTISLSSEVILDVLKFVPYENATKLVLTKKSWVKPLQIQLNEQRIARPESSDLGEKQREIKLTWNRMLQNKKQLCADLKTNIINTDSLQAQSTAIALFTQRLQTIQNNKNAVHNQICAIAQKQQPIIDKIESLESKLDQCRKPETERYADLKRCQESYQAAIIGIEFSIFMIHFSSSFFASITASKMATITLPSDVILDVLKFVPYENATKLVLTSKSWVKPLQIQLKEQRIAIIAEIRRLESSDLGEKQRKIKSDWDRLVRNEEGLCRGAHINTNNSILEQKDAITLFNQHLQTIQTNKNATFEQYCAIARKRQPIIDKLESLESKLNQCRKPETERFAELKHRKESYQWAIIVTGFSVFILFIVDILAMLTAAIDYAEKRTLTCSFYIFLIVSTIVIVLSFILGKLISVDDKLQLKVDRYENKKYID